MPVGSIVAVFVVVWWLSFVAVLPIGNRSQSDAREVAAGTDPGAPVTPRLIRKGLVATGLAILLTLLLFLGLSNETLHHYWNR
jgi:predicted secreted protein